LLIAVGWYSRRRAIEPDYLFKGHVQNTLANRADNIVRGDLAAALIYFFVYCCLTKLDC